MKRHETLETGRKHQIKCKWQFSLKKEISRFTFRCIVLVALRLLCSVEFVILLHFPKHPFMLKIRYLWQERLLCDSGSFSCSNALFFWNRCHNSQGWLDSSPYYLSRTTLNSFWRELLMLHCTAVVPLVQGEHKGGAYWIVEEYECILYTSETETTKPIQTWYCIYRYSRVSNLTINLEFIYVLIQKHMNRC